LIVVIHTNHKTLTLDKSVGLIMMNYRKLNDFYIKTKDFCFIMKFIIRTC